MSSKKNQVQSIRSNQRSYLNKDFSAFRAELNLYGQTYFSDKITDFSEIQGELQMNDYVMAHRVLENPPTSIKAKMDEPINNNDFEKMLEIRMKQRNDLLPHIKHKDIELKI